MRHLWLPLALVSGLLLQTSPALCTEAVKVDSCPFISWNGGLIAFERDTGVMLYEGRTGRLKSVTSGSWPHPGENRPCYVGKPIWDEGYSPAISPDASYIAWAHTDPWSDTCTAVDELTGRPYFANIYLTDLRTGKHARLTNGGGMCPAWSPDSRRIAFVNMKGQLRAIDVRTRAEETLATVCVSVQQLTWRPGGIAVVQKDKDAVAWHSITKSGKLTRVTKPIKLPPTPADEPHLTRSWALSRDGEFVICIDAVHNPWANRSTAFTITRAERRGTRVLASLEPGRFFTIVSDPRLSGPFEIHISGSGNSFAFAVNGSIWKGSTSTGRLREVTGLMYNGHS